jgi:hypothetical protein
LCQGCILSLEKGPRFQRVCDLQYELFTCAIRKQKVLIALTRQRLRVTVNSEQIVSDTFR